MKTNRQLGLLVLAVLLLIVKFQAHASVDFTKPTQTAVSNEIVVQLKDSSKSKIQIEQVIAQLNKRSKTYRLSVKSRGDISVLTVNNSTLTKNAISDLQAADGVKYAEPNFIYHATTEAAPTDPDLNLQWSIKNTGQNDSAGQAGTPGEDIDVLRVWGEGFTGNKKVVVAVIDTGVDYTHPDLVSNMYQNPNEIAGNGIDDDKNGFVDDVRGWDFQNNDNDPMDDHRHGTHCSGVIGAEGNNSLGIAGVNHQVTIMPIKFLGTNGGTLDGAVKSINYATLMKVDVMSNSWGGGGESAIMREAIEKARDAGILFVAAAGNSSANNDSADFYPANYAVSNVLSVAAIDNKSNLAYFSNYGKNKVHIAAPGVKIYSSVLDGKYEHLSGTSMACPHVAGVAALMISHEKFANAEDIKSRIIKTAIRIPSLKLKVKAKGRLSAYNAVFNQVPPNDEPDDSAWVKMDVNLESVHPYTPGMSQTWTVQAPVPAKFIRAYFSKIDTETNYDFMTLSDASGVEFLKHSGSITDLTTDYVAGNTIQVKLTSDQTQERWGFKLDRIEYVPASR